MFIFAWPVQEKMRYPDHGYAGRSGIRKIVSFTLSLSPCIPYLLNMFLYPFTCNNMMGKGAYLRQLTAATFQMKSVEVGKELEGSSPPSVFIGSWNYPDVYAGPMIAPLHGDTAIMDMPESWIPGHKTQEEIIGYRLNLVRGKAHGKHIGS